MLKNELLARYTHEVEQEQVEAAAAPTAAPTTPARPAALPAATSTGPALAVETVRYAAPEAVAASAAASVAAAMEQVRIGVHGLLCMAWSTWPWVRIRMAECSPRTLPRTLPRALPRTLSHMILHICSHVGIVWTFSGDPERYQSHVLDIY